MLQHDRNFTPRLSKGDLPNLADSTTLTRMDFQRACELWSAKLSDYDGMLFSKVVEPIHSALFAPIEDDNWRWLARSQRYRNGQTKTIVNDTGFVVLRDDFTDKMYPDVTDTCNALFEREITVHSWLRQMSGLVKQSHLAMWLLGSGGYNTVTQGMIEQLEQTLREQYGYLTDFANEIITKNRSDSQRVHDSTHVSLYTPIPLRRQGVINRATLYIEAITQSAERGRATSYGVLTNELPNYPGDGSTICLTRCRCHWRFNTSTGDDSFYHAFWKLKRRDLKNCVTCLQFAAAYNPFVLWRF